MSIEWMDRVLSVFQHSLSAVLTWICHLLHRTEHDFQGLMELHVRAMSFRRATHDKIMLGVTQLIIKPSHPNQKFLRIMVVDLIFQGFHISVHLCRIWLTVFKCVLNLTIFSSCPGGFLRKRQRGAKKISTIPIMVISQGNPILSAMEPPIDGPKSVEDRSHTGLAWFVWLRAALCSSVLTR